LQKSPLQETDERVVGKREKREDMFKALVGEADES